MAHAARPSPGDSGQAHPCVPGPPTLGERPPGTGSCASPTCARHLAGPGPFPPVSKGMKGRSCNPALSQLLMNIQDFSQSPCFAFSFYGYYLHTLKIFFLTTEVTPACWDKKLKVNRCVKERVTVSVPLHSPGRPCWAHGTCRDHRHHPASCPMALGRSQVDAPKEPHGAAGSCSPGRFPPGLGCHHHQAGAERVWLAQCHQESWLLVDCRGPWVACLSHPTQTHRVCVGHPGRAAGRRTKVTASQDGLASFFFFF